MIEVTNLSKRYGDKRAVNDITFTVKQGEIVGLLGPNGAGKSTTMNIITGYLSSSDGSVKVDGFDILDNPKEVKSRIGYLPEQPPLYMEMTVMEYLNFVFDLKKVKLDRKQHLNQIIEMVKIEEVKKRRIQNLSKGYKQRVGLAQALIGNPEVLILDEPTVGLDPKQIIEIRNVIKELGKNRTIILSSHILPEVSAICERIIIIADGEIVAEGRPDELSRKLVGEQRLQVRISASEERAMEILSSVPSVCDITPLGEKEEGSFDFTIKSKDESDVRKAVFDAVHNSGEHIMYLSDLELSLEDIFLKLTEVSPVDEYNTKMPLESIVISDDGSTSATEDYDLEEEIYVFDENVEEEGENK